MYEQYTIYGPYTREDRREHVVLWKRKSCKTISYPKFLMEQYLSRKLEKDEVVHHKDGDKTNNDIDNLIIKARGEHSAQHAKKLKPKTFTCPICEDEFTLEGQQLYTAKLNSKHGKAGPFCSNSCVGKYGALVQNNKMDRLKPKEIETELTGEYAN